MSQYRYSGVDSYAAFFVSIKAKVLIRTPHYSVDDIEDIKQELLLAYLLAWPSFDPGKGNPKSFIKAVINNRAAEMLREADAQKRWTGLKTLSLSTPLADDTDATIGDQITSDESLWGDVFGAQSHSAAEQNIHLPPFAAPGIKHPTMLCAVCTRRKISQGCPTSCHAGCSPYSR